MAILGERYNGPKTKLVQNKRVVQHSIEEPLEAIKQNKWSIKEMLSAETVIIAGFAFF